MGENEEKFNKIENDLKTLTSNLTEEKTYKHKTDLFDIFTSKVFIILVLVGLFFLTPAFTLLTKSYLNLFDLMINNNYLNTQFTSQMMKLIGTIVFLDLIIIPFLFLFFKTETFSKYFSRLLQISLIIIFILGAWGMFSSQYINSQQAADQAYNQVKSNSVSSWLNLECVTFDVLNHDKPECVKLRALNSAEVVQRESINIQPIKFKFDKIDVFSKNDYFPVKYKFDLNIPIKLTKLECYSSKDATTPFYNETFDNQIITGKIQKEFECQNIASILDKEKEAIKIESRLYFKVESTFTQDVLSVNCLSENILSQQDNNVKKCNILSLDNIKDEIGGINVPEYDTNAKGSNTLEVKSDNIEVLHIGDDLEKQFKYILDIKGKSQVGTLVSNQIKSIELPNVLTEVKQFSSKRDKIITDDDDIQITIGLKENDKIKLNKDIEKQSIKINLISTLYVKSGTSNKIDFIVNGFKVGNNQDKKNSPITN